MPTLPNQLRRARWLVCLGLALGAASPASAQAMNTYRIETSLGAIDVVLRPDVAPKTVANFLDYASASSSGGSIIHRSVPGFVIQAGGYTYGNGSFQMIPRGAPVPSEAGLSNTRGTISMALSNGPDSATSEWFFNLADNSALLDGTGDGGPFTVFGAIEDAASLAVLDALAALPVVDESASLGSAFSSLPVQNYTRGQTLTAANLVLVNSISLAPAQTGAHYTVTATPAALSIAAGQSASTTLTVTPVNGYQGTVNFSCGALPPDASCSFSPASVALTANGAAPTSTLTISTSKSTVAALGDGGGGAPIGIALFAAAALAALVFSGGSTSARLMARALACALSLGAIASCGGSSGSSAGVTPAGTYTVAIAVADSAGSQPLDLVVTVH